jgi:hypothetical protein
MSAFQVAQPKSFKDVRRKLIKYTIVGSVLVLALLMTMPFTAEPAEAG